MAEPEGAASAAAGGGSGDGGAPTSASDDPPKEQDQQQQQATASSDNTTNNPAVAASDAGVVAESETASTSATTTTTTAPPPAPSNTTATNTAQQQERHKIPPQESTAAAAAATAAVVVPPPTLNVYKKIAVIRHVDDTLRYTDATTGSIRTVSIQELGDAIAATTTAATATSSTPGGSGASTASATATTTTTTTTAAGVDSKTQEQKQQQEQPKPPTTKKLDIPVPKIEVNATYKRDVPPSYAMANSYVRYHQLSQDEYTGIFEYVADEEDEQWLANNSKFGGAVAVAAPVPGPTTTASGATETAAATKEEQHGKEEPATSTDTKAETPDDQKKDAEATAATATATGGGGKQPKQQQQQKPKQPSATVQPPPQKRQQLSLELLEQILDLLEKATAFEAIITTRQAEQLILSNIPHLVTMFPIKAPRGFASNTVLLKHVLQDVYNYWVQKRSKLKRPLLRRFWPVTSTEDTNPHLVFRPREKEKYKLRKKRQNDRDAYIKLKQLRQDFDNLRVMLELVKRREELRREHLKVHMELFQHRLHDIVDTSGRPRISSRNSGSSSADTAVSKSELKRCWELPLHFDNIQGNNGAATGNNRKAKRIRPSPATSGTDSADAAGGTATGDATAVSDAAATAAAAAAATSPSSVPSPDQHQQQSSTSQQQLYEFNVAGRNHGEPAPLFVHPLRTRESYVTSWEDYNSSAPCVPSYVDSNEVRAYQFRHRPRIGRGGRVCIDRMPMNMTGNNNLKDDQEGDVSSSGVAIPPPITVLRAGRPLPQAPKIKERLLDLLPKPTDKVNLSRKLQAWSVEPSLVSNGRPLHTTGAGSLPLAGDHQEDDNNNSEGIIVKVDDWLETDDQLWGEERFAIGPI